MEEAYIRRKGALLAAWVKRDMSSTEEILLIAESQRLCELKNCIRAQNPTWQDPYADLI